MHERRLGIPEILVGAVQSRPAPTKQVAKRLGVVGLGAVARARNDVRHAASLPASPDGPRTYAPGTTSCEAALILSNPRCRAVS